MQKLCMSMQKNWNYYIEEHRKEVAEMLAQDYTETEIAWLLQVQGSTVCRFVSAKRTFTEIRIWFTQRKSKVLLQSLLENDPSVLNLKEMEQKLENIQTAKIRL